MNIIKKIIKIDKEFFLKHPRLKKSMSITIVVLMIIVILEKVSINYTDIIRKFNESAFSTDVKQLNLSTDEKLEEFDYIYKTLIINMPSISNFKNLYDVDFCENSFRYRDEITKTKDDFDYFVTLRGVLADIPSAHTKLRYPNYENYTTTYGYNYDKFLATWNLENYSDYWNDLIITKAKECYDDRHFVFNYYGGEGKYFFNPSVGIAYHTDIYTNSYLISIDETLVDEYIKNNISYFDMYYDNTSKKVFRPQIMFNSVSEYGRKVIAKIQLASGEIAEQELYISCADDAIISYGSVYDERYAKNENETVTSSVPYYFYEDIENNLTYALVSSVDYGFGEDIANKILTIKTDNVILDLRDNSGGTVNYFYTYLYTPLFNNDFSFENKFYISETPMNKKNIFKINWVYDIYRSVNSPKVYYNNEIHDEFSPEYKIVEEKNIFNCKGGESSQKKVYVLIGHNTASAADGFAAVIKQGTNAVLIGENTAGEGMGGSYVSIALPKSKLAFSYYPALSFNSDGSDNSVYGTTPHYYAPDYKLENLLIRNNMLDSFGTEYTYDYEHRIQWDIQLSYTLEIIKEKENEQTTDN